MFAEYYYRDSVEEDGLLSWKAIAEATIALFQDHSKQEMYHRITINACLLRLHYSS
jgi:hypothetical protein